MSTAAQLAQKTKIAINTGTTATPVWTQIKEVKAIKPSGASSSKVDVTDLESDAFEYLSGLVDNGTLSMDINILQSDAGQTACLTAFTTVPPPINEFRVTTTLKHRVFEGTLTKWPTIPDASVNGVQVGSAEIQVSGAITVTAVV